MTPLSYHSSNLSLIALEIMRLLVQIIGINFLLANADLFNDIRLYLFWENTFTKAPSRNDWKYIK